MSVNFSTTTVTLTITFQIRRASLKTGRADVGLLNDLKLRQVYFAVFSGWTSMSRKLNNFYRTIKNFKKRINILVRLDQYVH